jgi:hypothetical protein
MAKLLLKFAEKHYRNPAKFTEAPSPLFTVQTMG